MTNLQDLPDIQYGFTTRPRPYPADLRADWRISAVILAVDKSRGKRASVPQLHVLVWAMLDATHGSELARALEGGGGPLPPVRFDPAVAQAVDRAVGLGLLERNGRRLQLSDLGRRWLGRLTGDTELMSHEKATLDALGGPVSMVAIDRVTGLAS